MRIPSAPGTNGEGSNGSIWNVRQAVGEGPVFAHSGRRPESKLSGQAQRWPRPSLRPEGSRDAHATRAPLSLSRDTTLCGDRRARAPAAPTGFEPVASAFGGRRRGQTAACAIPLTSRPDSEERTGIRFEKEPVYGYSGGAKALPGRPLAPAIAPIRGSRR